MDFGLEERSQKELFPAWADVRRLDLFCAGMLYGVRHADALWVVSKLKNIQRIYAAMGPVVNNKEFSPAAWVPYDDNQEDILEGCPVKNREFPWNFGDVLLILAEFQSMPTLVHLFHPQLEVSYVHSWVPDTPWSDVKKHFAAWATRENGIRHLHQIDNADPRILEFHRVRPRAS